MPVSPLGPDAVQPAFRGALGRGRAAVCGMSPVTAARLVPGALPVARSF